MRLSLTLRGNHAGILTVSDQDATDFSVVRKLVPGREGDEDIALDRLAVGLLRESSQPPAEHDASPKPESSGRERR